MATWYWCDHEGKETFIYLLERARELPWGQFLLLHNLQEKRRLHLYPSAVNLIGTRGRVLLKREGMMYEGRPRNSSSTASQTEAVVDRLVDREIQMKNQLTIGRKTQAIGRPPGSVNQKKKTKCQTPDRSPGWPTRSRCKTREPNVIVDRSRGRPIMLRRPSSRL